MSQQGIERLRQQILNNLMGAIADQSFQTTILSDQDDLHALVNSINNGKLGSAIVKGTNDSGLIIFHVGISQVGGDDVVG